jgi:hypothetical protein
MQSHLSLRRRLASSMFAAGLFTTSLLAAPAVFAGDYGNNHDKKGQHGGYFSPKGGHGHAGHGFSWGSWSWGHKKHPGHGHQPPPPPPPPAVPEFDASQSASAAALLAGAFLLLAARRRSEAAAQ